MDKDTKIKIKSMTNGRCGINIPELRLKRTWEKKGAIKEIDFDTLSQAIYYPGVEYMIKQGILCIEDMSAKIALGLEESEESNNIIILSDSQRDRFLKVLPFDEFKMEVSKLGWEQLQELVDYAIQKEYMDINKCEFLKKLTQIDIIRAIQLNRAEQEEE